MNILQMFSYPFMQRALIAGVLVSLCAALLGVPLVLKRYSMIGDGLSHVSFGALAIAVALGVTPLYFSIPVVILAAFFLLRMASHPHWNSDAAIAAVSASALAPKAADSGFCYIGSASHPTQCQRTRQLPRRKLSAERFSKYVSI